MNYTPIFGLLFDSDFALFSIFSFFVFAIVGDVLKSLRKNVIGLGISVVIYVICAVLVNVFTDLAIQIIALAVGAIALGAAAGFIIGLILSIFRECVCKKYTINDVKAIVVGLLAALVIIIIIIALIKNHQNRWSEHPFSTDKENIEWITIMYGYSVYEVPADKLDDLLAIFNNMRFKKGKYETDQIGGVLSPNPATVYHIDIAYKHGGNALFTIIPEAHCITIADDGLYYFKHYDEKLMDELVESISKK